MTDCGRGDLKDLLPDLLNERLDARMRAEVERHVSGCAECASELALLRSMRAALAPAPRVDTARISAAVRAASRAPSAGARRRRTSFDRATMWRLAAAFALVAVGIAGWAIAVRRPSPNQTVAAMPAHQAPARTTAAPSRGLVMDGGVGDLPDSDVEQLLQSLDSLQAVPEADPTPVSYDIGEGAM